MPVPINYRKSSEGAIASYNYFDIAEGTGITQFYAFMTYSGATAAYRLSNSGNEYSYQIDTPDIAAGAGSASFGEGFYLTFDASTFNLPKTIAGAAILNACFGVRSASGDPSQGYLNCKLQKVDALGTAVDIASGASQIISTSATSYTQPEITCVKLPVQKTSFKKGETLRLRIGAVAKNGVAGSATHMVIAHDPQNRDSTRIFPSLSGSLTTKCILGVPFKIDL